MIQEISLHGSCKVKCLLSGNIQLTTELSMGSLTFRSPISSSCIGHRVQNSLCTMAYTVVNIPNLVPIHYKQEKLASVAGIVIRDVSFSIVEGSMID